MPTLSIVGQVVGSSFEVARSGFPKTVRIETTNHCNASCSFCPRDTIGRAKTFMDEDLFRKIIDQCAENGCRQVHLHNFGEPLIDKKLPERIRYAKDAGVRSVKIISNGALLKGKIAERLIDSGLDEIKISIDGANSQEFNELRIGLDHANVIENTRAFRKLRDQRRSDGTPAIVGACTVTSDKSQTAALLADVVDWIDYARLHNWTGVRRLLGNRSIRKPCDRLWRTFTVLVNGDVALCCLDYSGREILGNCQEQSIREIWNSQRYGELRRLHRTSQQDQIPICDNCSKSRL